MNTWLDFFHIPKCCVLIDYLPLLHCPMTSVLVSTLFNPEIVPLKINLSSSLHQFLHCALISCPRNNARSSPEHTDQHFEPKASAKLIKLASTTVSTLRSHGHLFPSNLSGIQHRWQVRSAALVLKSLDMR